MLPRLASLVIFLAAHAGVVSISQAASVTTIGGGRHTATGPDSGFFDGNTMQVSQFHTPSGLGVDGAGILYLADRGNGAIRRVDVANNRSTTILSNLQAPAAVAVKSASEILFVTYGDGRLTQVDRFGTATLVATGLVRPTALALEGASTAYVTEEGGAIIRVNLATGALSTVATGLSRPSGIAVLGSGLLAVSDTGRHQVLFINPANGQTSVRIGEGTAGFRDGPPNLARFHEPHHLARTPAGSLVVADRLNHKVRLIDVQGTVTTLYGVNPSAWEGPECTTCDPVILPGWYDETEDFAEAREPLGVAVSANGTVFTTEVYYHILRQVTGADLTGGVVLNPGGGGTGGGGGGNTNLVVLPPTISPSHGYFPMGQRVTVNNPNSSAFFPTAVYYTTDGSEPTTNSFRLETIGGTGTILWRDARRDLTALRLKAYVGAEASATVSGRPAPVSEIGVPRDLRAGMGSTLFVPVVVNLRANDPLKSLQFRIEITPLTPGAPVIPETFKANSVSTNDFIRLVTADERTATAGGVSTFQSAGYLFDRTRGLAVTMIGTNANFSVRDFAAVALLTVPVPTNASVGDRYAIEVIRPSGTADGFQQSVPLTAMPARVISVDRVSYEVGDTAAGYWYNSDEPGLGFGDGVLDNADVNNVFNAALGFHLPPLSSDMFDAMDTYPEDAEGFAGGDGLIRFLDWQVVLLRSLGLDPNRWVRSWTDGGARTARNLHQGTVRSQRASPATTLTAPPPGEVWHRQATLHAGTLENVRPGVSVDVPVHLHVAPGEAVSGLAFRAVLTPADRSPALFAPMQFIPAAGTPAPLQSSGRSFNELLCGWALVPAPAFQPAIEGSRLLGHLRIPIPGSSLEGDAYTLSFENVDGAPSLSRQYDLESLPGRLWVLSRARRAAAGISDEWNVRFFGSATAADADPDADPDGDGFTNAVEYRAGTDPTNPDSALRLQPPVREAATGRVKLRWLSAPGKSYTLESTTDLTGRNWIPVAHDLPGDGYLKEWPVADSPQGSRFYRIRLQP